MITKDRYSRTISWLKVALPLTALAILSTLFLLSRAMNTQDAIPFADKEIQDRLRDQQITGPFFSGATPEGDMISFSAVKVITPGGRIGTNRAENILARIETAAGTKYVLQAKLAEVDIPADRAELKGTVSLKTSTGYEVRTDRLNARISRVELHAPDGIEADGPIGSLIAGNMSVKSPSAGENTQMLFSGGVKLVYTPNQGRK